MFRFFFVFKICARNDFETGKSERDEKNPSFHAVVTLKE